MRGLTLAALAEPLRLALKIVFVNARDVSKRLLSPERDTPRPLWILCHNE